jgi:hypothetical protein
MKTERFCRKDNNKETGRADSSSCLLRLKSFKVIRRLFKVRRRKDKTKEKHIRITEADSRGFAVTTGFATNSSTQTNLPIKSSLIAINYTPFSSPPPKDMDTASNKSEKVGATIVSSKQPELLIPTNNTSRGLGSPPEPTVLPRRMSENNKQVGAKKFAHVEDPSIMKMYDRIPELETTKLPRGGISIDTEAVGRVQVCVHTICSWTPVAKPFSYVFYVHVLIVWIATRDNQR